MRKRDWKRKGKNVLAAILSAAMVVNTALPEALVYAADAEADSSHTLLIWLIVLVCIAAVAAAGVMIVVKRKEEKN